MSTEQVATVDVETENAQEAVQPQEQVTENTEAVVAGAQSATVETPSSEKQERDVDAVIAENIKLNAESTRRRNKEKKSQETIKSLTAELEDFKSKPVEQKESEDYEAFQDRQIDHRLDVKVRERELDRERLRAEEQIDPHTQEMREITESYNDSKAAFLESSGVNPEVYNQHESNVNNALGGRPAHERDLLIKEISKLGQDVVIEAATNPVLLNSIYRGDIIEAVTGLRSAKGRLSQKKVISDAPDPVPSIESGGGIRPAGSLESCATLKEYRAHPDYQG